MLLSSLCTCLTHEPNILWRSGVILDIESSRALIKADMEERCIYVFIKGSRPRLALTAIRSTFEAIHRTVPGLVVHEKVPIPGHPEVPPVDYKHLLNLEKMFETSFIPEGMKEHINVSDLLGEIRPQSKKNIY